MAISPRGSRLQLDTVIPLLQTFQERKSAQSRDFTMTLQALLPGRTPLLMPSSLPTDWLLGPSTLACPQLLLPLQFIVGVEVYLFYEFLYPQCLTSCSLNPC